MSQKEARYCNSGETKQSSLACKPVSSTVRSGCFCKIEPHAVEVTGATSESIICTFDALHFLRKPWPCHAQRHWAETIF
jgi:hypothetical protein